MLDLKQDDKASSLVWRAINFIMAVFFMLAAYVNINDDDWYIWVPMYTMPALLCASTVIKSSFTGSKFWKITISFDFCLCLLYGSYQLIALLKVMNSDFKNPLAHEEGREMAGLLIIIIWAGTTYFLSHSTHRMDRNNQKIITVILWTTASITITALIVWSLCFVGDWYKHFGHCNNMFKI